MVDVSRPRRCSMRFHRTVTRPVMAATLLAGLVWPATGSPAAAQEPVPEVRPIVHEASASKPLRLVRRTLHQRYTVKRGDCLWRIARRELGQGRRWSAIYHANRNLIADPDLIYPGQRFIIPELGAYATSYAPPRHASRRVAHRLTTSERYGHAPWQLGSAPVRHAARREPSAGDLAITLEPVAPRGAAPHVQAQPAPMPGYETQTIQLGSDPTPPADRASEQFQGHHRVNGHFYVMREGSLVWADDNAPVRGSFSDRLIEQVYPSRQAAAPAIAVAPPPLNDPSAEEGTIQGHRRINGTFFTRRGAQLVWSDTGESVRTAARPTQMLAP